MKKVALVCGSLLLLLAFSSCDKISSDDEKQEPNVIGDDTNTALAQVGNVFTPSSMKDNQGRLNTDVKFKITSEGIQDTFNPDKYLHTMVKFDCNVGDQYNLTGSDNKTVSRTVTAKSTNDDFPYGFWTIIQRPSNKLHRASRVLEKLFTKQTINSDLSTWRLCLKPALQQA